MQLRDYQKECLAAIPESGSYLIQMATGLGKSLTFSRVPRRGKMLILSHREELVWQPKQYFDCSFGVEMASVHSMGEDVISASVQSFVRRLKKFPSDYFDIIIVDEAHHACAPTYIKILKHFTPRLLLGFTATPNRDDGIGLDTIFTDIIYEKDLSWGIKNGFLCDIRCLRVDIGYDLRNVAMKMGDYSAKELDTAVNIESANKAIADTYRKYATGQTLIFAVSVEHARNIACEIDGAVAIIGGEKREEALNLFRQKKIRCLVNCMVFTEGTDLPMIDTIIMARPTANVSLYTQCVGRGTRLCEGKEYLNLIDCVGASRLGLCTAPTLIGEDIELLQDKDKPVDAMLFDLPDLITREFDRPEYWIKNAKLVDLWAKQKKYSLHKVNYFRMPSGHLVLTKPKVVIDPPDKLGNVVFMGEKMRYQKALDTVYIRLNKEHDTTRPLWDKEIANKWGQYTASDKQKAMVKRFFPAMDVEYLTKAQAGAIITRVFV